MARAAPAHRLCASQRTALRFGWISIAWSHIRKRDSTNTPHLQDLGAFLQDTRHELRATAVGQFFSNNPQTISALNREMIPGQEPCVTHMHVDYAAAGL